MSPANPAKGAHVVSVDRPIRPIRGAYAGKTPRCCPASGTAEAHVPGRKASLGIQGVSDATNPMFWDFEVMAGGLPGLAQSNFPKHETRTPTAGEKLPATYRRYRIAFSQLMGKLKAKEALGRVISKLDIFLLVIISRGRGPHWRKQTSPPHGRSGPRAMPVPEMLSVDQSSGSS